MPIRVTCVNCHTRFDVSDKFAGKEGPCPKCKATIKIPGLDEQVVIHAPEESGPKDTAGRPVLKPISRRETRLSGMQLALILGGAVLFLILSLWLRNTYADKSNFPVYWLVIGALVLAPAMALLAYTFLRNQEAAPYTRNEMWIRICAVSAAYALLWLLMPLMQYAFVGNAIGPIAGLVAMIAAGGSLGMLLLEFDFLLGVLHYGMYLVVCLIGRVLMGLDVMPGGFGPVRDVPSTIIGWQAVLESAVGSTVFF